MKKIAFIGHSFHQKTGSDQFFIDLLLEYYEIEFYWSLPGSYKSDLKSFDLQNRNYHAVIFFQILPTPDELQFVMSRNIILVPMFDNDPGITLRQWSEYSEYKFINFSRTLYSKLEFLNFQSNIYLQFAPNVSKQKKSRDSNRKPKVFFWQRSKKINWSLLKKLINFSQISSFHLHRIEIDAENDDWFEVPEDQDLENYNVTFSSWFDSKDDLYRLLSDCDIFVAPRLLEGIGQIFLEAMALGKCVISPNLPTMNEYIDDGVNGILYELGELRPIDLTEWRRIGYRAYDSMGKIRSQWELKQLDIIHLIERPLTPQPKKVSVNENVRMLEGILSEAKYRFIVEDLRIDLSGAGSPPGGYGFSRYLNVLLDYLSSELKPSEKYIVYGTGTGASLILGLIGRDSVEYFIDIDRSKHGSLYSGKVVFGPEKLKETTHKIIISVFGRCDAVVSYLTCEYGIEKQRLLNLDFN